jgi:hypothetical protein
MQHPLYIGITLQHSSSTEHADKTCGGNSPAIKCCHERSLTVGDVICDCRQYHSCLSSTTRRGIVEFLFDIQIMALETDIVDRVRDEFSVEDAPTALKELVSSGKTGRFARCILLAADGSLERLRDLIDMANWDHRDVIVAGEYDGAMQRIRDLRASFLITSPDDFWIAETAVVANKRGFQLIELESHPATVGPFDYTCDRCEGIAMFSNGTTTLTIQKHNRQWSISAPENNLRPFGLENTFDDEGRFLVQLDYYLSRK